METRTGDHSRTSAPRLTVAHWILEVLRLSGIDCVFGLPGVHILSMWNALNGSPLRYIGLRHEHAATHAADAYGRVTGKPGVVLLSTGPGALNALSGLGEAYASSSPVMVITSGIPTQFFGEHKGYLHEIKDLEPAFEAVTRFVGRPMSVDEVPDAVRGALEAAFGGRPGPTLLEIPTDLFDKEIFEEPKPVHRTPVVPTEASVQEAERLLSSSRSPVIWAGGGVLRSGASKVLEQVADLLDAPVVTTFMGKGAIPETHLLSAGVAVRHPEAQSLLTGSDLLLAVGTRFTGMSTSNWRLSMPGAIIQIDVDTAELGRNYPLTLGVNGDAKASLEWIIEKLPAGRQVGDGRKRVAEIRRSILARARETGPQEFSFLTAMRSSLANDVVLTQDMTIPSYWAVQFLPCSEPNTFLYPYGYASLGFSLPAAIGAAAAGKTVVAFCGDGGFQYHSRELSTLVQYNLPVTVIVFNDGAWGVLKTFSESRFGSSFGMDLPGPDFVALSLAHGVPASRADEPEELALELKSAVAAGGPRLIEVVGPWQVPPPVDYYT